MLSTPLLWLFAGSLLCLLEAIFPTAFVELIMGISAIVVAVIALIVPNLTVQVVLWLLLSTTAVILSRRLLAPKRRVSLLAEETEGKTLTEIEPGEAGRVLYEGSSWRAICADENLAIASDEKVYILHRKGNTLIVMPILGFKL